LYQGSTIAEEEDEPIMMLYRKNREKAAEQEKDKTEQPTIKKLYGTFNNLQAVSLKLVGS